MNGKRIIIEADRVKWEGFDNVYEILGFVRMHVDRELVEQSILAAGLNPGGPPGATASSPPPASAADLEGGGKDEKDGVDMAAVGQGGDDE